MYKINKMTLKKYRQFTFVFSFILLYQVTATAQVSLSDTLVSIYSKYDSLSYISFDVKYHYTSDTLNGDFTNDFMEGSFTMAGKKARYNIGDIEFMQNEKSFISVYKGNKLIIISDAKTGNSGNFLPLRDMMDSLVQAYSDRYDISVSTKDSLGIIRFTGLDSNAAFKKFIIKYNLRTRFLNALYYEFDEPAVLNPDDTLKPPEYILRRRSFAVMFKNYRLANFGDEMYDENYFAWPERGVWQPSERFKGYRVYYNKSGYVPEEN